MTVSIRSKPLLVFLLVTLSLTAFLPAFNCGFINYDDPQYVYENPNVIGGLSFTGIQWAFTATQMSNWHPVTWISHQIDCQLFGLNPRGHHASSIVLHICNSLLLFLALCKLTGTTLRSAFVALLFALHPLHVESAVWISERKDLLCAMFFMTTLVIYCHYINRRDTLSYLSLLLACIAGFLSKPMMVSIPLILLLLDWWPLKRFDREPVKKLLLEKTPLFAFTAVISVITIVLQKNSGALASIESLSFSDRLVYAAAALSGYIAKTFAPYNLTFFYPLPRELPIIHGIISIVVCSLITLFVITQHRKRPYLAVGWFWFLITIAPVIGLIQVGIQAMADRYSYLPLIGLFIMVAWGGAEISIAVHSKRLIPVLAIFTCSICAVLTFRQTGHWKDSITLYSYTLGVTRDNFTVHYNLGVELARMGRIDEAIQQFDASTRIEPEFYQGHYNSGAMMTQIGKLPEAIQKFKRVIAIAPDFTDGHYRLAQTLEQTGKYPDALYHYQLLYQLSPDNAEIAFHIQQIKGIISSNRSL